MNKTNNKVISLPKSALPEIFHGSVHSPGNRLTGSRSEIWLCPAYCGATDVMLYVKPSLTLRQVVAELVVAQVARAMKLPVPQPYLVSVAPHCVGRPRGRAIMAFGSEQVGARGLATPVKSLDLMLRMLQKAKAAEGTAVLDELVANDVRGPGDVVFDPEGSVWLIDHEAALRKGLRTDQAVTNWVAARLKDNCLELDRAPLLAALRAQAVKARNLQLSGSPADMQHLNGAFQAYEQVLEFIQSRLEHLDQLLSERILPEQQYLAETPAKTPTLHDTARVTDL